MTHSKKKFAIILALVIMLVAFCSVFAVTGVFSSARTVQAATLTQAQLEQRRANPGLYETGTTTLKTSWADLVSGGKIYTSNGYLMVNDNTLAGDLVCGSVSGLTSLYGAFGSSNFTSIDCSNLDTSNVTNMNSMFSGCESLTSIYVSNFNTSNVTNMSYMFNLCSSLTSLDVSGWDTSNVENMECLFSNCKSLQSLNLSNFNTSNVTNMRYMFNDCLKLSSLNVSSFNTSKVTNMYGMFWRCSSLQSLDLSTFDTSNVTDMSIMFDDCSSLKSLDVSNFNTSNVKDMRNMFSNCSSLKTLNVSNFDTSNVTSMGYMFYDCTALTSLDVSGWDTSKVTNFTAMFGGTKLTVLDMTNFSFSAATDATKFMGMLGINDTYCLGVLQQQAAALVPVYQSAMKNEDISATLSAMNSAIGASYSSAIAGKSGDEVGYVGRVYVVGYVINNLFYDNDAQYFERSLNNAQTLFDTKIGTIYAPANAISYQISLPFNTNYVYLSNGTKTALSNQLLYGYKDIDSSLTELALFEGELDKPAVKPSEEPVPSTGVVANISMLVVAIVSVFALAMVLSRKKRMAK